MSIVSYIEPSVRGFFFDLMLKFKLKKLLVTVNNLLRNV